MRFGRRGANRTVCLTTKLLHGRYGRSGTTCSSGVPSCHGSHRSTRSTSARARRGPTAISSRSHVGTHLTAVLCCGRSWHLHGVVGTVGCPGFVGPVPLPVSMRRRMVSVGPDRRQVAP
jgi:hypothetical protein